LRKPVFVNFLNVDQGRFPRGWDGVWARRRLALPVSARRWRTRPLFKVCRLCEMPGKMGCDCDFQRSEEYDGDCRRYEGQAAVAEPSIFFAPLALANITAHKIVHSN